MNAPVPDIPALQETSYSRERLLKALREEEALPDAAIAVATLYAHEIESDLVAVIERAAKEPLDPPTARLFFRGIHILGGRRFSSAYRPLVMFLQGSNERVEDLLSDAVTETLPKILAGVFDGDEAPLLGIITNRHLDEFVRTAALNALAFLTFDGRVPKPAVEDLLRRFDLERMAENDNEALWGAWMIAIALLGMERLSPNVRAVFADRRIPPSYCGEDIYEKLLNEALQRPADPTRFEGERLGYIEDVLEELQRYSWADESEFAPSEDFIWSHDDSGLPRRNPMRHVGRNDPCPCGSGKKAKKCCLQ
jgi:hypothetical protein